MTCFTGIVQTDALLVEIDHQPDLASSSKGPSMKMKQPQAHEETP
jgi:hypothetical protein